MKDGYFIGEEAVNMFSFNILHGDKNPLHDPYSIVLTDETARILFNTTNAVGKIVKLDNAYNLKVTAVVAKQPKNSSLFLIVCFHGNYRKASIWMLKITSTIGGIIPGGHLFN